MEHCLGYIASGVNLVSMGMKDIRLLRGLSLTANAIFVVYGIQLGSSPIVISCSVATLIHAYHLLKLGRKPTATVS